MEHLKDQLSNTVQEVLDGKFDPLEAYGLMADLKKHIETCLDVIKPSAIIDATRYGAKPFKYKDFEFTYNEGRRTYDFKSINPWVALQQQLKDIEESAKWAAAMMEKGKELIDDNGEVVQPCKVKYSESYLTTKIIKQ